MNTIDTIKADIAAVESNIAKAKPLADKLAEMQAAIASIAEANQTLGTLRGRLAEAETAQRNCAAALTRYTIESIRQQAGEGVSVLLVGQSPSGGPARPHTVTLTERITGINGEEVRTLRLALHGLSPQLLGVVVANADMLPAYIRALDADPEQAVRKHAQHVMRGYMSS